MEIKVEPLSSYANVKIVEGGTTIELGLLNKDKRDELAGVLICAAYDLGPRYSPREEWFSALLSKHNIKLPNKG